jgi:hypothetical protein
MNRTVCVEVALLAFGINRKVDTEQAVERTDVDKSLVSVTKQLLDSEEYDVIRQIDGSIRRFMKAQSLPSLFRGGVYLLPLKLVDAVDTQLISFKEKRRNAVVKFCEVYETQLEEARGRLGPLFNENDYPSRRAVQACFGMEVRYMTFAVPSALESVSSTLFQREQEKAERKWQQAGVEIQQALRVSMSELITHMVDQLKPQEGGERRKIIRASKLDELTEFLDSFKLRNVTDDDQMEELVKKAKAVIQGMDIESLRFDSGVRERVRAGFSRLKDQLNTMITEGPRRAISFDDEGMF